MQSHASTGLMLEVDPIEEMRLRTWARQNYVPPSERDITWPAIVLDEMRRMDLERD